MISNAAGKGDDAVLQAERYVRQRYSVHLPCAGNVATSHKVFGDHVFYSCFF